MDNGTNASTTSAVTSLAYHIPMWLLAISGILGNVLVVVWRCYGKESRLNLLSVLIVSLAVADLCFCVHYLLQEVMLVPFVFGHGNRNKSILFTSTDQRLCASLTFLTFAPMTAIMLTSVAITLYSLLSLRPRKYGNRLIKGFVLISWMACLILGALSAWESRLYYPASKSYVTMETFYRLVISRCLRPDAHSFQWSRVAYPVIAMAVNILSSLLVPVLYISLCCKIKKINFNSHHYQRQKIDRFRIRMTAISILNLICWWPLGIVYVVTWARSWSQHHSVGSPFVEPYFIFLATVSAANPIIYTIASRRFCNAARHACKNSFFCHRCNGEEKQVLPLPGGAINYHVSGSKCCGLLRYPKKAEVEVRCSLTSGETGETGLFTDDE